MNTDKKKLRLRCQWVLASLILLAFIAACGGGSDDDVADVSGPPEIIETNPGSTSGANIVVAKDGQAIVIWSQTDGVSESLWSNRYEPKIGWGTPETIDDDLGRLPSPDFFREHLSLAMAPDGTAIVVWTLILDETNDFSTYANQYMPGVGWGTPEKIEQNDGWTFSPQIAMDDSGNAIAVWLQVDGSGYGDIHSVWTNRYEPLSGWGTPELLETEPDTIVNGPSIAMNASGSAIVAWQQWENVGAGRYNAWANRFEPGIGWGTPFLLEKESGQVGAPRTGVDANGNSIVTWMQSDSLGYNLWAIRYEVGTGWGLPEMIEDNPGDVDSIGYSLAVSPYGDAFAFWSQTDGLEQTFWTNHFVPNTGWGSPELVATNPENSGYNTITSDFDFASSGDAFAVWTQSDTFDMSIWARRYSVVSGWGAPFLLEENEGSANSPKLAIDSKGKVITTWAQWDGTQDSQWAYRY